MKTQMQRFDSASVEEKFKILRGAIEGLTNALAYHIKVVNKHTERIENLEKQLKT